MCCKHQADENEISPTWGMPWVSHMRDTLGVPHDGCFGSLDIVIDDVTYKTHTSELCNQVKREENKSHVPFLVLNFIILYWVASITLSGQTCWNLRKNPAVMALLLPGKFSWNDYPKPEEENRALKQDQAKTTSCPILISKRVSMIRNSLLKLSVLMNPGLIWRSSPQSAKQRRRKWEWANKKYFVRMSPQTKYQSIRRSNAIFSCDACHFNYPM